MFFAAQNLPSTLGQQILEFENEMEQEDLLDEKNKDSNTQPATPDANIDNPALRNSDIPPIVPNIRQQLPEPQINTTIIEIPENNDNPINDVPVNKNNYEEIEEFIEKRKGRKNEKKRFNDFLHTLTIEEYKASDLLAEYKNFFHSSISPIGLGRMIEIKQNFEKSRRRFNGYPTVFYKKRDHAVPVCGRKKHPKQANQSRKQTGNI